MFGIDPSQLASLPVLIKELGILQTLMIGSKVQLAVGRGEPFEDFGPAADERERLSREQIAPAIVLYRELLQRRDQAEALAITEKAVVEGAVAFLRQTIGRLDRAELEQLDDEQRREFARSRGEKFFNATVEWEQIDGDRVDFTVVHCLFPGMCADLGHPELAPVFCAGDAKFFGTIERDVTLTRPQTIARGAESCLFRIAWADE